MKAIMSGRASAYATCEDRHWSLHRLHREAVPIGDGDLERIFGPGPDVVRLDADRVEIARRFQTEWAKDRALRILLILLDPAEKVDGLQELAALLDPLLAETHVRRHIESQLFHQPLPSEAELDRAIDITRNLPQAEALVRSIANRQGAVTQVRQAFDGIDEALFGDGEAKAEFMEHAINAGAFRELVLAANENSVADAGIMNAHQALARVRNARNIVTAWTSRLRETGRPAPRPLRPEHVSTPRREEEPHGGAVAAHQGLQSALQQQAAVIKRIEKGDYDTARRYALDLERQQLGRGDREHLAMSLTRLSQAAREMEALELEVEWSRKAVDIAPDDARARTQLGDALLAQGSIEDALAAFSRAEELGERPYALGGRARAMRILGDHETQLALLLEADALLVDSDERVHALVGVANAFADLNRTEDAAAAIETAERLFPYHPLPRMVHGWLLMKRGRYVEAQASFEQAEHFSKDKSAPLNALAELSRRTGRLADARIRYSNLTRTHPRDPSGYAGLVDTLRDEGRRKDAADFARRTAERFPGSPRIAGRQATTASEAGRHVEARRLFSRAIARFPRDPALVDGQVCALMREGAYELALQTVDRGLQRHSRSPSLHRSRANILRRLRRSDLGREAFERIGAADPSDQAARNALASILILEGSFDYAERLVAIAEPVTRDDWRAFLLLSNLRDRQGEADEAGQRLSWAAGVCPFPDEARMFATALANQALRSGRARSAPRVAPVPVSDVGNVIDFQVAAATKRRVDTAASLRLLDHHLSPPLALLRDEIAANYGVAHRVRRHSKRWIGQRLNDELVLAAA